MAGLIELPGTSLDRSDLKIKKAKQLAEAAEHQNYISLVTCIREPTGTEVVVLDAEVELPQNKAHDIRRLERIAVRFDPRDEHPPDALALRRDFPVVPHLNIRQQEFPRSLCIFEEPYSEFRLFWTASEYIRHLRDWLALTARGELHRNDQPLEPLLLGDEGTLILPPTILEPRSSGHVLVFDQLIEAGGRYTLVAKEASEHLLAEKGVGALAVVLTAKPQTHGLIRSTPKNLEKLNEFLELGGLDLLNSLRQQLRDWNSDKTVDINLDYKLIILVLLPKLRNGGDTEFEEVELRAFITTNTIIEVGIEIGIWDKVDGRIGYNIPQDANKRGQSVKVHLLNPMFDFSPSRARALSGLTESTNVKIAQVGVGALGSQVAWNLMRMGFGHWTLIDDDILLPHNVARHALGRSFIGFSKADGISFLAGHMMNDNNYALPLVENVMRPSNHSSLASAFSEADIILDTSTSIAAARHLALDVKSNARRISMFLSPKGSDVVVLAEDKERSIRLDMLEMAYYRGLIHEPCLHGHLRQKSEGLRYGTSCRDLSSTIPQSLIGLHSGICSQVLIAMIEKSQSTLSVWTTNTQSVEIERYDLPVGEMRELVFDDWRLVTDGQLLEKVARARYRKLPNETGGVLIGSYDTSRKIIYVVDTIPAPPDSIEWPTVFIRGAKGLRQAVERVQEITGGRLQYVGEWHSHPVGAGAAMSHDDTVALSSQWEIMTVDGFPALMLIVADDDNAFFLRRMEEI